MIETYKRVTGKYQPSVAPTLHKGNAFVTRDNNLRLEKSQVKYDLRKFGFTKRVGNTWSSLSNWSCLLTLLTRSKQDWINSGTTGIVYTISGHSCKEPKVVASFV